MKKLTLGSLFDGIGGFPYAASLVGIEPIWAAEIDPFGIAVTKMRFPNMQHLGSVTKIHGYNIPSVDIISFGSPCQDLSVAGKRAGMKNEGHGDKETTRSGLFFEAIRIIYEMRSATDGKYPTFIIWENVPGAFSSNHGRDFQSVLSEITKTDVPMPQSGKWCGAGMVRGGAVSVAWRVFDAQFWGVPQRRKRIYLVGSFGSQSPEEILFKRDCVRGYLAQSGNQREDITGSSEESIGTSDFDEYNCLTDRASAVPLEYHPMDCRINIATDRKCQTLTSRMGTGGGNVPLLLKIRSECEGGGKGPLIQENKSATLSCNNDQTLFEPCGWDGGQISPTLTKQNAGGNQRMPDKGNFTCVLQPFGICSKDSNAMKSNNPQSGVYKAKTARTLDCNGGNPVCNQGGIVVAESYSIQGSVIGRKDENGPQGDGINKNVSFTLNTIDRHAVYYGIDRVAFNQGKNAKYDPAFSEELSPTLVSKGLNACFAGYGVRRLTPLECERLQGYPDNWTQLPKIENLTDDEYDFYLKVYMTDKVIRGKAIKVPSQDALIKWYNKLDNDGNRYKALGNSLAIPCALRVMEGIEESCTICWCEPMEK